MFIVGQKVKRINGYNDGFSAGDVGIVLEITESGIDVLLKNHKTSHGNAPSNLAEYKSNKPKCKNDIYMLNFR